MLWQLLCNLSAVKQGQKEKDGVTLAQTWQCLQQVSASSPRNLDISCSLLSRFYRISSLCRTETKHTHVYIFNKCTTLCHVNKLNSLKSSLIIWLWSIYKLRMHIWMNNSADRLAMLAAQPFTKTKGAPEYIYPC